MPETVILRDGAENYRIFQDRDKYFLSAVDNKDKVLNTWQISLETYDFFRRFSKDNREDLLIKMMERDAQSGLYTDKS